jgi:magnesium chelatase subunit I
MPSPSSQSISIERPQTLAQLRKAGWVSKSVKQEIHDNFLRRLQAGDELYPGIIGFDDTVLPELNIAILAQHDLLFLGEKGQAKSRLMRLVSSFLDEAIPYLDDPAIPLHDDPYRPITKRGRTLVSTCPADEVPIAWWSRDDRYAERLSPGTKFADIIGEIDPAKLAAGVSMSAEDALHFGLIPRMHRGIFAMNELPELDELVQVGLFNILEERDVQIRGYPVKFDIDVMILFSANPATYNRSGKVIPQLKDRIGSIVHTHYPLERDTGVRILEQEVDGARVASNELRDTEDSPSESRNPQLETRNVLLVIVPYFMKELIEEISRSARKSKYVDHESGVSAPPCSAKRPLCRESAISATSPPRRSASWNSTSWARTR